MGKASTRAQNRYIAKAYDRINLTVPKGHKDVIQTHAAARSESVNGFINRAITEAMEWDGTGSPQEAATALLGAGAVSLPPDTLEAVQRAAEAAGEPLQDFIRRAADNQAQRDKISRKLAPK